MIKVLVAEDQAMLLTTLATILDLEDDIQVIHQSANGQDALNFILDENSEKVDLVVTDIEMPKLTGLELAKSLQKKQTDIKIIILTTFSRSGYLRRAIDAGIKGYLLKDSPSGELIAAIRKVSKGGKVISPELMQESWMEADPLTEKERKALRLAKDGQTTEQIAEQLYLSPGTVRNYLSSASNKLNAKNRIEAARIAHKNGWL